MILHGFHDVKSWNTSYVTTTSFSTNTSRSTTTSYNSTASRNTTTTYTTSWNSYRTTSGTTSISTQVPVYRTTGVSVSRTTSYNSIQGPYYGNVGSSWYNWRFDNTLSRVRIAWGAAIATGYVYSNTHSPTTSLVWDLPDYYERGSYVERIEPENRYYVSKFREVSRSTSYTSSRSTFVRNSSRLTTVSTNKVTAVPLSRTTSRTTTTSWSVATSKSTTTTYSTTTTGNLMLSRSTSWYL